jgi:putative tryptophan/tyrosine transport system substrate-binding protein
LNPSRGVIVSPGRNFDVIDRRRFIAALGGAAATWPPRAGAQPAAGRLPRIAFLSASGESTFDPRNTAGFKAGLAENGLIDGRTVVVEYAWAEGRAERLRELATRVAAGGFDVIVTAGTQAARDLVATGTATPIVLAVIGDPVGAGLVKSLASPGGTITGLSMSNAELEAKRIEILKAAVPAVGKIAILHDPTMRDDSVARVESAVRTLGLQARVVGVSAPDEISRAFADAGAWGADGLAVMASSFLNVQRSKLIELANRQRLPSIWEADTFARDGGLLSYGPSFADMYRRSANHVARILKGARPADLPVEQPTRFELVVNLATARLLKLTLPPTFLARADEVIE